MAKKDELKKIADEIYTLNYQIEQLNARLILLSSREGDIAGYTEYLATNLDLLISYAELLAELYSSDMVAQNLGNSSFTSSRRAPSFDEYKEIRGGK